MARRRKQKWPTAWVPWQDSFHELFFPSLTRGWTAPHRVRVFHGRAHMTVVARFTDAGGMAWNCKAKIPRPAS
jgi:hypothetical protein